MLKTRIRYGLVCLTAIALFLFYHNFFFFFLLMTVILFPFISIFASMYVWNKTDVSVNLDQLSVIQNNDIEVDFITVNKSLLSLPHLNLEFKAENHFYPNNEIQILTLPLRTKKNRYTWKIKSVYSGQIEIKGIRIYTYDYLGIVKFQRNWNYNAGLSVLPQKSEIFMNVIGNSMTEGDEEEYNDSNSVEDVTQVKEFRQYKPGDRLQRVNWKISARYDELYVKEFEREYNKTVVFLAELKMDSRKPDSLDNLITVLYSASVKLIELDYKFKIQWYDIENSQFCFELVENEEDLTSAIEELFMMSCYDDYEAYKNYIRTERENEIAIYFTQSDFVPSEETVKIGTFRERISVLCLY